MGDVKKRVLTKYELDAKQALAAATKLQKRMSLLGRTANKVTSRIGSLGRMLAVPAGLSLAGGVGLVKHIIDVGRSAEDAKLSLAEMLQAISRATNLNLSGFEQATAAAAKLREMFFSLARDSPLNARQIEDAFSRMSFSLSRAGISLADQVKLARDVAVADLSSIVKGTAAIDVQQILAGTATMKQITTKALQPIKEAAIKLGKSGKVREAADLIMRAVTLDPKALAARGKSAGGMIESFGDRLFKIKTKIAEPLLKFLVEKMEEWGDWLDKNQDKVKDIAMSIGKGIVKALKAVVKVVKFLADNWKTILTVVKTLAIVWIAGKLVSGISSLINLASRLAGVMRDVAAAARTASVASAAAGGGGRRKGGILGKVGKVAGAASLAVLAATEGETVGIGAAKLFTSAKEDRQIAQVAAIRASLGPKMTKAEYHAYIASTKRLPGEKKLEEDALKAQIDPTKAKRGRGRGGRTRVKTMEVERFEVRDRDFARLSTRFAVGVRRESRAMRQITGLGLGAGAIGVGVS